MRHRLADYKHPNAGKSGIFQDRPRTRSGFLAQVATRTSTSLGSAYRPKDSHTSAGAARTLYGRLQTAAMRRSTITTPATQLPSGRFVEPLRMPPIATTQRQVMRSGFTNNHRRELIPFRNHRGSSGLAQSGGCGRSPNRLRLQPSNPGCHAQSAEASTVNSVTQLVIRNGCNKVTLRCTNVADSPPPARSGASRKTVELRHASNKNHSNPNRRCVPGITFA